MPAVELTSVPAWAVAPARPDADLTGRYWTIVAFDDGGTDGAVAAEIVATWRRQLTARHPGSRPRVHRVGDHAAAERALGADLATALVGWRLMVAGPAEACLHLRACAVRRGVSDDEITVATTTVAWRAVHCAHCRSVTRTAVELAGTVACTGCGRNLLVHQHVSRRIGAHLGVMTEDAP